MELDRTWKAIRHTPQVSLDRVLGSDDETARSSCCGDTNTVGTFTAPTDGFRVEPMQLGKVQDNPIDAYIHESRREKDVSQGLLRVREVQR